VEAVVSWWSFGVAIALEKKMQRGVRYGGSAPDSNSYDMHRFRERWAPGRRKWLRFSDACWEVVCSIAWPINWATDRWPCLRRPLSTTVCRDRIVAHGARCPFEAWDAGSVCRGRTTDTNQCNCYTTQRHAERVTALCDQANQSRLTPTVPTSSLPEVDSNGGAN